MLLLDVDAVCKLGNWQLLNELPNLTGVAPKNMMTVGSLIHRAKRSAEKLDKRLFVNEASACNVVEFLQCTSALHEPTPERLAIFQDMADIDVGEAILFSVLLQYSGYNVVTGDKRSIRALTAVPKDIREALAGRVICLEQIMVKALSILGLARLQERVCPHRDIDRSISNVMGSRCDADEAAVVEGLNSYINELNKLYIPSMLAPFA